MVVVCLKSCVLWGVSLCFLCCCVKSILLSVFLSWCMCWLIVGCDRLSFFLVVVSELCLVMVRKVCSSV